ncbi:hypothetical protein TRVL_00859 [Trypanosoma vivax]|nr:hypothetical protein TRVL_00859 [Trypanosoma vivax]
MNHRQPGPVPAFPLGGNEQALFRFLKYLPALMRMATEVPGVVTGFVFAWTIYFFVIGREALLNVYSPVAGFHIVAFLLLRELVVLWNGGRVAAEELKRRNAKRKSFARDVQMQWHEKLD